MFKLICQFSSNFRAIGVESMKWVDIKHARDSLINENTMYITRQETDDPLDKSDTMLKGKLRNLSFYAFFFSRYSKQGRTVLWKS